MAKLVCKFCAKSTSTSLSGFCPRSPTKSHDLVGQQDQYTCKFCGRTSAEPFGGPCKTSPHGNHELRG